MIPSREGLKAQGQGVNQREQRGQWRRRNWEGTEGWEWSNWGEFSGEVRRGTDLDRKREKEG